MGPLHWWTSGKTRHTKARNTRRSSSGALTRTYMGMEWGRRCTPGATSSAMQCRKLHGMPGDVAMVTPVINTQWRDSTAVGSMRAGVREGEPLHPNHLQHPHYTTWLPYFLHLSMSAPAPRHSSLIHTLVIFSSTCLWSNRWKRRLLTSSIYPCPHLRQDILDRYTTAGGPVPILISGGRCPLLHPCSSSPLPWRCMHA